MAPTFRDVRAITVTWYLGELDSLVDTAIKACLEECDGKSTEERRSWLESWVSNVADKDLITINPERARAVAAASTNRNAYEDERRESAPDDCARAECALRADMIEALEYRKIQWETKS